jgi:hypothetical protein
MKKLLYSVLTTIFLFSAVIGCSDKTNKEESETNTETNVDTTSAEKEEITHPSELAFAFIKSNLSLSLTKQEVAGLLGTNFTTVELEHGVCWRYNVGADTYETEVLDEVNETDYEAIKEGKINAILFIQWNEEVVDSYTIYYFEKDINTIKEYKLSSDGETYQQVSITNKKNEA